MPTYVYKAKNLDGEVQSGSYAANTVEELEEMLHVKGFFLVEAQKQGKQFSLDDIFGKVNMKDISVFCRQFSVIINAGISLVEAVEILAEQTEKKVMLRVLREVHEELQKGRFLSELLLLYPNIFPEFLVSMVRIGETSGTLDTVMDNLADYYERENKISRKVKAAMTYPTILGVITVGVIVLLMVKVLPMFTSMLSTMGGDLPGITKVMMGISAFFVKYFFAVAIVVAVIWGAVAYYLKTDAGRLLVDGIKLKLPVIKVTTVKVMTSRFSRSMGILLKSGIPVMSAIDIMSTLLGNRAVEVRFKECKDQISEGRGISGPIEKLGIFPPLLIHMVAVGEKTGELDDLLTRTAGFFDEEVEEAIEKMTALIEPAMLLVMAVVVGAVVMAVLLPMVNIMNSIH